MIESLYKEQRAQFDSFASAVWGNPDAVLKRSGDIQFIDLKHYPALRCLFLTAWSDKILVREEYRIALQALETETYYRGAYVTGQPGIGKTFFLIYVLVMHLGQKRPVALQTPDGAHHALFRDTVTFHHECDQGPLFKSSPLWALSDSSECIQGPSVYFRGFPESIRVIQATAPEKSRWKQWSKYTGANGYIMDIWTEEEIVEFDNTTNELLGLGTEDAKRMTFLAKQWGCVPQTLLQIMNEDDSEIEARYRVNALTVVLRRREAIPAIAGNAQSDDTLLQILFCRPRIDEGGHGSRQLSRPTVLTETIYRLLEEALQNVTDGVKLEFFTLLCQFGGISWMDSGIDVHP